MLKSTLKLSFFREALGAKGEEHFPDLENYVWKESEKIGNETKGERRLYDFLGSIYAMYFFLIFFMKHCTKD